MRRRYNWEKGEYLDDFHMSLPVTSGNCYLSYLNPLYWGCMRPLVSRKLTPTLADIWQVSAVADDPRDKNLCDNYSGQASEMWGIINVVDRLPSSLSRSERLPSSS